MSDQMFMVAMLASFLTGWLSGLALGVWIGEKVTVFINKRE